MNELYQKQPEPGIVIPQTPVCIGNIMFESPMTNARGKQLGEANRFQQLWDELPEQEERERMFLCEYTNLA